jgi:hypothetical protein
VVLFDLDGDSKTYPRLSRSTSLDDDRLAEATPTWWLCLDLFQLSSEKGLSIVPPLFTIVVADFEQTRCDGGQPACLICQAYHDECCYDKAPPMSQITWMTQRLQELERIVAELRTGANHQEESESKAPVSPLTSEATAHSGDQHTLTPELPEPCVDANGRVGCPSGLTGLSSLLSFLFPFLRMSG